MKNTGMMERLIAEQWRELKKKAQNATDPERLIAVLEEIDSLLFRLETTAAAMGAPTRSTDDGNSTSVFRIVLWYSARGREIGSQ